jgi:hypothetical protein
MPKKRETFGTHHAPGRHGLMYLLFKGVIWFRIPELLQSAKEDVLE